MTSVGKWSVRWVGADGYAGETRGYDSRKSAMAAAKFVYSQGASLVEVAEVVYENDESA